MSKRPRLNARQLLPLALPLLPACVQEIPVPYVGECTDYPVGAYDFGDFTMGDCLSAPTDLKFYEGPDGPVLYVVNSNAWMVFGDGSISAYSWDSLASAIEDARASSDPFVEAGGPAVLLTSDPGIEKSSISTPYLNGRLITASLPDGTPVAFVSNRLSLTTDKYAQDPIYAYDLTDPLNPLPLALSAEDDPYRLTVEEDPWGLAYVQNARGSYLLNVNQTEHSVSVNDARALPIVPLTGSSVGLVTWPGQDDFSDLGMPSFAETGYLSVGNILDDPTDPDDGQNASAILSDAWTLTWLDGTYRMFLLGKQDGQDVLGYVDASDALSFSPVWDEPILAQGDSDAWDSEGLGRTSILLAPSSDGSAASYLFFYEGWKETDTLGRFPRFGLAISSSASLLSITKQDLGEEDLDSDDFLIGLGEAGSFTEKGLGAPWAFTYADRVGIYFEGVNAAGQRSLGFTSADATNLGAWDDPDPLVLEGDAGDEQREPTGFFDGRLGRFRMWFVRVEADESCIAYADSDDGLNFTVGGIDGQAGPCLTLPGDAPRAPSINLSHHVLHLWYQSEGPVGADGTPSYLLQSLYGFDGMTFRSIGSAPLDYGMDWEEGAPLPSLVIPTLSDGTTGLSLEGEQYRAAGSGLPLNAVNKVEGLDLYLQILHGHVLGTGARASLLEDSSASTALAWDSLGVRGPAYDSTDDRLYYTGISLAPEDGTDAREVHPYAAIGSAQQQVPLARWENGTKPVWPVAAQTSSTGGSASPSIVHHDGQVWMFYTQGRTDSDGASIRLVTRDEADADFDASTDAEVLLPNEVEGETHVASPSVVAPSMSGGAWHMWFTSIVAGQARIGHASSSDGRVWTRPEFGSWALEPAASGSWDDASVAAPSVLLGPDGVWHLFYAGDSGTGASRIGYASADLEGAEPSDTMVWTRFTAGGKGYPVLYNEGGWWDVSSVTEPTVAYVGDRYKMWYEGQSGGERRIGLAESFDALRWFKVYEPLTTGDRFTFRTRVVSSEDGTSAQSLADGKLNLESYFGSYSMCGIGATELEVAPGGGMVAISALHTPGIYLMDTRDDSSGDFFDDNYLGFEAVIALRDTSACGPDSAVQGTRSLLFSPDGTKLYATTRLPDSVLVADLTLVEDQAAARLYRNSILLGAIELEPGSAEDQGLATTTDIGPIGLAMTRDGRYMWVANSNGNSVYTIDLSLGTVGEVVEVAEQVGELPVALALSPDEKYLLVANYVGDVEQRDDTRYVVHSTLAVIDADRNSPSFGHLVAHLKNLELN